MSFFGTVPQELLALVDKVLDGAGTKLSNITLVEPSLTEGNYDPRTGVDSGTSTNHTVGKGLSGKYKHFELRDGIQAGDVKLVISAKDLSAGVTPSAEWSVKFGGLAYKVVDSQPVKFGDTVLMHVLQLRR